MTPNILIGIVVALTDKVPKYEHKNPWPGVPFVTPDLPTLPAAIIGAMLAVGIFVGLTWEWL